MLVAEDKLTKLMAQESTIHGVGLFAKVFFKKGDVVVPWKNTREITFDEFAELPITEKQFTDFQNGKMLLIGKPERFVNHSCDANTIPGDLCDIASRDIFAGEEITSNYSNFFILSGQFNCSCGSPICRKVIYGKK
jgi:SET domain-containing protein